MLRDQNDRPAPRFQHAVPLLGQIDVQIGDQFRFQHLLAEGGIANDPIDALARQRKFHGVPALDDGASAVAEVLFGAVNGVGVDVAPQILHVAHPPLFAQGDGLGEDRTGAAERVEYCHAGGDPREANHGRGDRRPQRRCDVVGLIRPVAHGAIREP